MRFARSNQSGATVLAVAAFASAWIVGCSAAPQDEPSAKSEAAYIQNINGNVEIRHPIIAYCPGRPGEGLELIQGRSGQLYRDPVRRCSGFAATDPDKCGLPSWGPNPGPH